MAFYLLRAPKPVLIGLKNVFNTGPRDDRVRRLVTVGSTTPRSRFAGVAVRSTKTVEGLAPAVGLGDPFGHRRPRKIRLVDEVCQFVNALRSAEQLNAAFHGRFPSGGETDRAAPKKPDVAEERRENKVNSKSEKVVDPGSRTNDKAATIVSGETKRPPGLTAVADNAPNLSDPIRRIEELCAQRMWRRPQFNYGGVATDKKNSAFHGKRHTTTCVVIGDNNVEYRAQGVGGNKKNAKRIAAIKVYGQITEDISSRT